jgi:hypothetical protein
VTSALHLRVALRRGALITAANWPLVAVQFAADSLYQAALGVPIVGGALMVAILIGDDLSSLLSQGLRAGAGMVLTSLFDSPVALVTFVLALGVVAAGGAGLLFLAKAGTLAVLVEGERQSSDELHAGSLRFELLRRADAARIERFLGGVRHFGRRFLTLGMWLLVAYAVVGGLYAASIVSAYRVATRTEWISAFPLVLLAATSALVVCVTLINLLYVLLQIIVVSADCPLGNAVRGLRAFLLHDARQVAGIFGVILTITVVGTAASLLVTAGLGLIAWVPLVGLSVVPLQAAAWLVRGLVFEFIDLTALAAYVAQYRRCVEQDA